MPELPEVETVRRSLEPRLLGRRLISLEVRETRLRVAVDERRLQQDILGRSCLAVSRRSKYLRLDFAGGTSLLVHLGMSGRLYHCAPERELDRHDHLRFGIDDGAELRYCDPRRFGLVLSRDTAALETDQLLAGLGPEPLGPGLDAKEMRRRAAGRRVPIKTWIMNPAVLVGVGNIYASEALHRAGIRPTRPAGGVSGPRWELLVGAIREVLEASIAAGGTTLKDFVDADGRPGWHAQELEVYGREGLPCRRCGTLVRRILIGGRSTFFCPRCQR